MSKMKALLAPVHAADTGPRVMARDSGRASAVSGEVRRQAAEAARATAVTEEQVAATSEKLAESRQGPDAERLQAKAQEARQCAAQEECGI